MFKRGDRVVKKDGSDWDIGIYRTVRVADEYGYIMLHGDSVIYCDEELKLYQEEGKMEKTFREVIATIKEGEVWESIKKNQRVERVRLCPTMETIVFEGDVSCASNDILCAVNPNSKFKLQRKQYSFEEALKEYENGKEIESVITGFKYIHEHGIDCYADSKVLSAISFKEIRGKWYIND